MTPAQSNEDSNQKVTVAVVVKLEYDKFKKGVKKNGPVNNMVRNHSFHIVLYCKTLLYIF